MEQNELSPELLIETTQQLVNNIAAQNLLNTTASWITLVIAGINVIIFAVIIARTSTKLLRRFETLENKVSEIHTQLTEENSSTIKGQSKEIHQQVGRINDVYVELTNGEEDTIRKKTEAIHKQLNSTDENTVKKKVDNIEKQLTNKEGNTIRKDIETILNKP